MGSHDHWITLSWDHTVMGSQDHWITLSWDHTVIGLHHHGITWSMDNTVTGSNNRGITRSWDHAITGSHGHGIILSHAGLRTSLINNMSRYLHSRCQKEKSLLFEQMKDFKNSLKSDESFTILEIGAGSGMNFTFFPKGSQVICLDPNPLNEKYILNSIISANNHVQLVKFIKGVAENMSDVPSGSFDAVVCTFTMCSIPDLNAAIEEVRRVLKPGGKFFFLEHVAAPKGTWTRYFQDALHAIVGRIFHGHGHGHGQGHGHSHEHEQGHGHSHEHEQGHGHSHEHEHGHGQLNKEIWTYLDDSKFKDVRYSHFSIDTWIIFFAKPGFYGSAVK
ncbi:Methyltransferase-like protein 7A [Bulinus truncatus]|nr:Methyltransferase-like protein 7A [Bulinus truncatus]